MRWSFNFFHHIKGLGTGERGKLEVRRDREERRKGGKDLWREVKGKGRNAMSEKLKETKI